MKHWAYQSLVAWDQFINCFLFGGWADETLSARAYRCQEDSFRWTLVRQFIDALFYVFETDHCQKSFDSELTRRHLPPQYR